VSETKEEYLDMAMRELRTLWRALDRAGYTLRAEEGDLVWQAAACQSSWRGERRM
jgi:hypothetical protein